MMKEILAKTIVSLILISFCSTDSVFHQLMDAISTQSKKQQFKLWHYAMGRPYDLNSEFAIRKYKVFKANLKFIENANSNQKDYILGLGPFTDLSWEEYEATYLSSKYPKEEIYLNQNKDTFEDFDDDSEHDSVNPGVVSSKDWRNLHPIAKDQGQCGSCWAFAASASLEGQLLINSIPYSVSEQELVDCTYPSNIGCKGGFGHDALKYVQENGITSGIDYRYIANSSDFRQNCQAKYIARRIIKTFKTFLTCSNYGILSNHRCTLSLIKSHMDNGPVATMMEVQNGLQHYRQGKWFPTNCKQANHEIENVFFQVNPETLTGFVTIRNSWSQYWGNYGLADVTVSPNQGLLGCGILLHSFIGTNLKTYKDN